MRRSQYVLSFVFGFMMFSTDNLRTEGLLYPRESETREVKSLDGIWNFVKSNQTAPTEGIRDKWYLDDLSKVIYFRSINAFSKIFLKLEIQMYTIKTVIFLKGYCHLKFIYTPMFQVCRFFFFARRNLYNSKEYNQNNLLQNSFYR